MSFKSKRIFILLLLLYLTPVSVFAYSKEIIAGGENIGIKLNTKGIMIVGTYSINGEYPSEKAGLKIGDSIVEINGENVSNIDDLASKMNDVTSDEVSIKYIRNSEEKTTKLKLYKDESNVYKTGLFVKDSIIGIGTLTFIDPSTKKFGALGHEILEQSTGKILGRHEGCYQYTIGQRKGIGIAYPYPLYVLEIDAVNNVVYLGKEDENYSNNLLVKDLNLSYIREEKEFSAMVKIRYNMSAVPAKVFVDGNSARVIFDNPVNSVTKGQACVFYDKQDGHLIGGGEIEG